MSNANVKNGIELAKINPCTYFVMDPFVELVPNALGFYGYSRYLLN